MFELVNQKRILEGLVLLTMVLLGACQQTEIKAPPFAIAIHGGAGTITRKDMTPEKELQYKMALDSAISIGTKALEEGKSCMDAVEKTIRFLEDNPLFNAGKGAVFTHEGKNELDASIMEGASLKAGSIGGVSHIKNPITLARWVMEKSPHVLLTGKGAETFALENGMDTVSTSYFFTQRRWESLQKVKAEEDSIKAAEKHGYLFQNDDRKFGTVGCVALDKNGNLAAGTSTGGMTNKRWNRFGDAPIIGAGTYADNSTCAISCTGHGEYFIRYAVAHDISALVAYKGMTVEQAGNEVINNKLKKAGGEGGCIILDKKGNISMPFNSEGMYRASFVNGVKKIEIYKD